MSALPSGRLWWPIPASGSTPVSKRLVLECKKPLAEAIHLGEANGAKAQHQADLRQHIRGHCEMKIKTFAELTTPNEFVLRLTPLGFSTMGTLSADDAAKFQQETIAGADLHDDVPEDTRKNFERLRALHSYGILCYDAYTVAEDLAWLVLEGALRERFISAYSGEIPLVKADDGTQHPIVAQHFDEVDEAFRPGGSHARGTWSLKLTTGGAMPFRGRMGQLLEWARKDGLLPVDFRTFVT